jgi:hypothetical protein
MYSLLNVGGDVRRIEMHERDSLRFRFFNENKKRIRFKREGSKLVAFVKGKIAVYKKPHTNKFHREYMRQNGLALYRGLPGCDSEQLTDNMLEYIEVI